MALLELDKVTRHFEIRPGLYDRLMGRREVRRIKAVESVSVSLERNEVLGIAGESGCGKSTTCMMIAGLLPPSSGRILHEGKPIDALTGDERQRHRRHVQMIFQDPYESLNPRFRTFDIVAEGLLVSSSRGDRI